MAGIEARRSPRVLLRLGVLIEDPPPACPARTAVVNRHGALLLSPRAYAEGTALRIRNLESDESVACSVVWSGGTDDANSHKLGVEFAEERPDFWGAEYERAVKAEAGS
ncbi:MAG TPA: PilZ domain-containing protein [Vicinamibacteria bacterium]|nr:PilZ domain-containing protein [Vicinamibacteria bacterium]